MGGLADTIRGAGGEPGTAASGNGSAESADAAMFPTLTDEEIACLTERGKRERFAPGDAVFIEGEPARNLFVVLEGAIRITKRVGGGDVVITVHHPREFTGELSLLTQGAMNIASGHAVTETEVLRVESAALREVLIGCPTLADRFISAMSRRVADAEVMMQQREKLASLGTMAAGLAHELNNPAAAARSAAAQLRKDLNQLQTLAVRLHRHRLTDAQVDALAALREQAAAHCAVSAALDPLAASDREEALTVWLESRKVPEANRLAGTFVPAGLSAERLDALAGQFPGEVLPDVLAWLAASFNAAALVDETEQSTARISELVKAIKQYAFMDQAPLQEIDLHAGLENTLLILHHKLKHGMTVTREYDRALPRISAYGSELNQVWTNLIDNAIDATGGHGRLTIRTARDGDCVLVEIIDDGPAGVPEAVQARMFEPFFTTKGVGKGTGLGLSIAYKIVVKRHHGDIRVVSRPGETRFQVRLPVGGGNAECRMLNAE
jgi:signal transduction histidine kinase